MTVQDVNVPPRVRTEDVKGVKPKSQDDAEYWEKQKVAKRFRREALEEDKAIQNLENPPLQEPPFQIRGQVDLGTFNLQEEQKKARDDADLARKEYAEKEKELSARLETSQKELAETKLTVVMKEMTNQFLSVVKAMDQKIDAVAKGSDPSHLTAYIDTLEKLASKMGYQRGDTGSAVGDPHLAIELQKLKAEEAARERAFQLEMKKFDYEMQRNFKKDDAEIILKKEELEMKKKRDEMFASAPELIGRAIARGMMEEGGTAPVMSQKVSSKGKTKGYQITAVRGEAGEVDCPKCGQPIVIGPTAATAACAGCSLNVPVTRTQPSQATPQPTTEELEPDEEEESAGRIR